jgi:hypothetical protein
LTPLACNQDIISACNARRPSSDTRESTVICREAAKKKKPTPVRSSWNRPEETSGLESVLHLAKGSGGSQTSRCAGITGPARGADPVLQRRVYKDRLIPLPAGDSRGPDAGVELFSSEGTYRSRTSRDNHYDTRPTLTLGVVTFSEAQADCIETALGKARQQRADLVEFFTNDRLRGFFVKTVQLVQGGERDIVIVPIGYGPDEDQLASDFGPLSKPGGATPPEAPSVQRF